MKREIPLLISFLSGALIVISLFIPHPPFNTVEETLSSWYTIIAGFTFILGIDSLLIYNWDKIRRKQKDWPFAATVIASFFITLTWGIVSGIRAGHIFAPQSTFRTYFYDYIYVPLQASMFAILSFFIASAAYRAFRARNLNATLLLITATIVMLGRVPLGNVVAVPVLWISVLIIIWVIFTEFMAGAPTSTRVLYILAIIAIVLASIPLSKFLYGNLSQTTDWIMNIPQMAAKRGIMLGLGLGAIAVSIRIILGIERSYMS